MKFAAFFVALIVGFTATSTHGEVLIYSGTVVQTELAVRKKPFLRRAFLVTDPIAKSTRLVTYAKVDGVKDQQSQGTRTGDFLAGALGQGAPLVDLYTFLRSEMTLGILQESLFIRGIQKQVQVNSDMGVPVNAMRAKTLKGSVRLLVAALGGNYLEQEISVTLDEQRTIEANVRGLSATAAFNELTALLSARGFN
jgi:hypothetical protein